MFEITNCINAGFIKGTTYIGGIIGRNNYFNPYITIDRCINTGVIAGNSYAGGIFGFNNSNNLTITNCYYDKQMCLYGGINNVDVVGQAEGKLTKEMIGNNLQAILGNTD
jgi:hypothetical protein